MSEPNARRPLPRSVYVRRRIVVVVIAVAIIVVLIAIFWPRGAGGAPGDGHSDAPGDTQTNGETALGPGDSATSPSDPEGTACDPSKIQITANTDKQTYAAGDPVQLTLTLTNNSSQECVIAAGTDQQVFAITSPSGSGDEPYWTSTDCQTDATPQNVLLQPGVPVPTPPITWDRHKSVKGSCDPATIAARPLVPGGGAHYDLTVKLGDLTSEKHAFYLG